MPILPRYFPHRNSVRGIDISGVVLKWQNTEDFKKDDQAERVAFILVQIVEKCAAEELNT